ncbi:MAG: PKD domain-containing protein [Bacteroidetes bacterium]|nr:PKD domain-containing protein [Bacteroidota bacterium]
MNLRKIRHLGHGVFRVEHLLLQHPTNIQYHAVGSYNVTLTVTNADGSNTKTK